MERRLFLVLDNRSNANPHDRMVVYDEHSNSARGFHSLSFTGEVRSRSLLLDAIRRVIRGNQFLPPPVKREVLRLMVAGKSNREIGEELTIREATVKSHVSVILMRLQVTDRTQAVVRSSEARFGAPLAKRHWSSRGGNPGAGCVHLGKVRRHVLEQDLWRRETAEWLMEHAWKSMYAVQQF